jgi:hypothetical protein
MGTDLERLHPSPGPALEGFGAGPAILRLQRTTAEPPTLSAPPVATYNLQDDAA